VRDADARRVRKRRRRRRVCVQVDDLDAEALGRRRQRRKLGPERVWKNGKRKSFVTFDQRDRNLWEKIAKNIAPLQKTYLLTNRLFAK
jgi:hypothetical protein